jgi:dynein heavy chain
LFLTIFAFVVSQAMAFDDYERWDKSSAFVIELFQNLEAAKATIADFNARERKYKVEVSEWPTVKTMDTSLDPFYRTWHMIRSFEEGQQEWMHGSFMEINAEKAEENVMDWYKKSAKLAKLIEDEHPHLAACASRLREETGEFRKNLPIMVALATPALKQSSAHTHWERLSTVLGVPPIEPNDALTLEQLIEMGCTDHVEVIEEISNHASKQFGLEKQLNSMKADWVPLFMEVKEYKKSGTSIIGGLDDILALLDEHIVKTQTMRGSPFAKGIMTECVGWEEQLKYGQAMLDEWIKVQRTWMYLEPIFASDDIMRQLPTEAKKFNEVDKTWRGVMEQATAAEGHFLTLADKTKRLQHEFNSANSELDEVQKGLADYLEIKRNYFPRFYFLSNDELLEIISQTKDPTAVQQHLNKAFEGIAKVKFEKDLKISEMRAAKGEVVVLDTCIDPESVENKGNVECWLKQLERMQWRTLKTQTELGLDDYKVTNRADWTLKWPQQVILGGSSVYWTIEVNDVINSGGSKGLREYVDKTLNPQLLQIVELVRKGVSKVQMSTLGCLVVIDVHARDTIDMMSEAKVESVNDFNWVSQLRYTWDPSWKKGQAVEVGDTTLVCRIVNAKALYGYEYLGNGMRLVITPLTDRCYRTMIGAIELLYGGAPEGPAGTGKTETVKDLSKAVAIHCVVFNCSDSMDYLQMAKFFKGLAGCGSWCCFDEFNRINVEVLSVIAQQILTINNAKKQGVEMFWFEGTHMELNQNCNAYITMNPGYAGRTELPDNLKALFRPCAMMVPDYALISEIRLYSFGFGEPRGVAQKLVKVLQLSSEQLSSQKHYDYGMRAVQSILVACGAMFDKVGKDPNWSEAKIVLRSVYDVNYPKFTVEDLPLFKGITSDLFPGIELPVADHGPLLAAIDSQCREGVKVAPGREYRMDPIPSYTNKIRELYEMVLVRHGVMICGTTGSGKTVGLHCLKQALTLVNSQGHKFPAVKTFTMNPKSIKSSQLYGNFDENTHEWSDGILPVLYRAAARDPTSDRNWVIFDGPVDAVWIENMNTVLDDNKKLCLNSGEIIKMSDEMTMMFEAEDLEQASPATISRVGMVFCETRNVGWRPLRNVWLWNLETFADGLFWPQREYFEELFEWLYPPAVFFVQTRCRQPAPVTDMEMIASMLRMLTCFLNLPEGTELFWDMQKVCECVFLKALTWSVGATIDGPSRGLFNDYIRSLGEGVSGNADNVAHADFLSKNRTYDQESYGKRKVGLLPDWSGGNTGHPITLFDVRFDPSKAVWSFWVPEDFHFEIAPTATYNSVVVPTVDTIRNEFLMDQLLTNGFHVMCTGETGTGKSVSVKKKLLEGMDETYTSMFLNFSAQTGANGTQDIIDGKLDKRRKGVLGPPVGKKCIVMVDDLNMPAKEEYGAQPPIEILRQWMDHAGWYDREENVFRELVDIQFITAMGPPGGGRTFITQRYMRHFNVLNFVPFSDQSLTRVFSTIVNWFLANGSYNEEVCGASESMVKATIDVYNTITANLRPTPAKSHYLFNLRDIAKVFQGVSQGCAVQITKNVDFCRIWAHECLRVFADRLINDDDRKWFTEMLAERVVTYFDGLSYHGDVCGHDPTDNSEQALLFGNYMVPGAAMPQYMFVDDFVKLNTNMVEYLEEFNSMSKKPMALVLFGNAIEHISRISRVISQPSGNALLVGVGGSGRKSLTTLSVSIADFKLFQIEISKSYAMNEWREDMKLIMGMAGEKDLPTVFLFDDTQIVYESFLEDVNGILNTGEVANLFTGDELMAIFANIEKSAAQAGVNTGNANDMYAYFVGRCKQNLHVVLCMSPIGDAFRTRLRMFPALVNCCTIDWFTEWPEDALRTVAVSFLSELEMEEPVRAGLVNVCVQMQSLVTEMSYRYKAEMGRFYYVTPTSYLELISTFRGLLNSQRTEVMDAKIRYDNGLEKIADTQSQVDVMKKELIDLQPLLKEATIQTNELIVQIDKDTIEANEKKAVVEVDEKECQSQADSANAIKTSCEADLAKALPALAGALKALKSLSKGDIVEVKAMGKPPGGVKITMEAMCIMFGIKAEKVKDPDSGKKVDDYWGPAKKELLGDPKFLDNLVNYDKDNMDPDMVLKVGKFCERDDFTPEMVLKGSVAAAGLCKWVHAMMLYDDVAKNVAPKKAALAEASASLAASTAMLAEKQGVLKEVLDKLALLQAGLDEAQEKKEALADQVEDSTRKLERAGQLLDGLGGERDRWKEFSAQLAEKYENVTGDIMLSAGVVAYLGSFVSSYREEALSKWSASLRVSGITCSNPFSLRETLGSPVKVRQWVIDKLPNDNVSIENAIMLERSNRWPLMIDPQGQANRWVKNSEGKKGLKVLKLTQSNFVRSVEAALQFGNPVLLENVMEAIDPVLEPVLLKQIVYVGGSATIKLGDATVDYDTNFKLYITTKLRNPHYPPELCVKVNLLNFMATSEGLEDQMQGIVVAMEEAALEAMRERLVLEDAESKATLQGIEDQILNLLKNAEGNILDDEVLINTLAQSKKTSVVIEAKVAEAAKAQVVIAETRRGYAPVAKHASILFFCIADLSVIDPMYQYSLDWFIGQFQIAIGNAEKADPTLIPEAKLKQRMANLNECFTYTLYLSICRSLFEKDKLLFSCLLCTKIMIGAGKLDPALLRFVLTGSTAVDLPKPNPFPDWLPEKAWGDLLEMDTVKGLEGFLEKVFMSQPKAWQGVMESNNPTELIAKLTAPLTTDAFALLCILRALRPDKVVPDMQLFIANEMGTKYIEPPSLELQACYNDSFCNTPLIFVLTPGADPMTALIKLADEMNKMKTMTAISLGQGQGPLAEAAITAAIEKGFWVCLQNCHLSVSWLPTLERICEELNPDTCHKDFRLWLTSEPSPHFPAYVLQNGVKMTVEPPKGMRASLTGAWAKIEESWFESCSKPDVFKKLLFGLTFLHATLIERRKFGPLGWNVKYVFSGPDMSICMDQLKIFLDELQPNEEVPYAALAYLAGECNYGGRCTDDKDRRCLVNTISDFYAPHILDDSYKFSPSGTYYAPPQGKLESYRDYVKTLPYSEGPEVFGLHENANISTALSETSDLLGTMQSLQPQSGGGAGKGWDEILLELGSDIAAKVPGKYDVEVALLDFPVLYEECMNTVLVQELIRFNRVIATVASSLKEVQRAVKGLVVMSGDLEAMGNSMVIGKVPAMWMRVAYPSLKSLGGWVKDFLERLEFLRDWFNLKTSPPRYWVSGFFFTQAFITGTLQNFARKYKIPIDQCNFDFAVLTPAQEKKSFVTKAEDGAFIWGLFMDGARWNVEEHCIDESLPRVLFVPMPCFHLWPKAKKDIEEIKGRLELYTGSPFGTAHVYSCPVYKTSERRGVLLTTGHSTNFVMWMRIPMASRHEQIHWIKRGVAMLTMLDD